MLTSWILHGESLESMAEWLSQKAEGLEKLSLSWCEVPPSSVSVNTHFLFQHSNTKKRSRTLCEAGQERSLCTIKHGSETV